MVSVEIAQKYPEFTVLPQDRICFTVQDTTTKQILIMKSYIKVMERIFPIASTASREKKQKMHHKSEKTALCQSGLFFLVTDPNVQ